MENHLNKAVLMTALITGTVLMGNNAVFAASLVANFVGDRTSTRAAISKPQRKLKPQCFTDLHFTYSPEKNQKAFLHINNLFDRIDVTSNSTSNFLSLGRNFMVGYEYSF